MSARKWLIIPATVIGLGMPYLMFTQADEKIAPYIFMFVYFLILFQDFKLQTKVLLSVLLVSINFFVYSLSIPGLELADKITVIENLVSQPEKSAIDKPAKYSATDACEDISTIQYEYFAEFDEFRFRNNGKGWAPLKTLTDKATSQLSKSITKIDQGISWDSDVISSGMLSTASSYMTEIVDSSNRRYFPPGRDLEALLREIRLNLSSVVNSACS